MATTKKSTKAKTKTPKKTVTKATASAAKTAKKAVAAKTVKPVTKARDPKKTLRRLNVISAVLSLAAAAAAGLLMNSRTYQLFTGLVTKDPFTGNFAPALHSVYDIELRWAVVGIMILAAIIPLLAATRKRRQYEASLAQKVMLWRWIDLAVISALMVEVIALVSGVQDIMTLKLLGGLMLVTCLLGYLAEKHKAGGQRPGLGTFMLSLVTGTLPWLLIASYAVSTLVWGMVREPWFVYALYGTTLLAFISIALNQYKQLRGKITYEFFERRYLLNHLFAKLAFAAILIAGLKK